MARAFGLDVSSVQGAIEWNTVARFGGLSFAYCKATSGVGHDLDPFYARNMAGAKSVGLARSLYHWWVWSRDPVAQAAEVEWAAGLVAGGVDMPIAIDFEAPDPAKWIEKGCKPADMVGNLVAMADDVARRLGRAPVIYTYPWFMAAITAPLNKVPAELLARLADFELWIAAGSQYAHAWTPTAADAPTCPPPWAKDAWAMWQYSGNGGLRMPGIFGDVDRDAFNGTADEFKAWAAGAKRTIEPVDRHAAIDTFTRPTKL